MSLKELLTHDFKPFKNIDIHISKKDVFTSFIFLFLPNIFFLGAAYFTGLSRPLFDVDYLIPSLIILFPYKILKLIATLLFIFAILLDAGMLTIQMFPFADVSALISLAPHITIAPLRYQIAAGAVAFYILFLPFLMNMVGRSLKVKFSYAFAISAFLGCFFHLFSYYIKYYHAPTQYFGHANHYVIHSQYELYTDNAGENFIKMLTQEPTLIPSIHDHATKYLNQEKPTNKVLVVVAESWGAAREDRVTKALIENISKQDNIEFLQTGFFDFAGATVQAELRELCRLNNNGGYSFRKLDDSLFKNCLPHKYKAKGYKTVAMHGAGLNFYDRGFWYPKAGFEKTYFSEDLLNEKRCSAFKGVCDSEMYKLISKEFKENEKVFFYWLTLTSHASFPEEDLHNPRLNCETYKLYKGDICNSFRLHAQFFDGLAELIKQPEMKGAEVIVVGDHMPPIVTTQPLWENLRWNDVAWLHFKIKD